MTRMPVRLATRSITSRSGTFTASMAMRPSRSLICRSAAGVEPAANSVAAPRMRTDLMSRVYRRLAASHEVERHPQDRIDGQELETFEPIRLAVLHEIR